MLERTDDEFIKSTITENLLSRNKKLIYCVDFLLNQTNNSVISINGKWGSGKTVFAKQIEYVMKHEEEYKQLCSSYRVDENANYNSWENDSINMPVHSLLLQLIKYYNVKSDTPLDLKKASKKVLNIMTKLATNGAVDIEDLNLNKTEDEKINALLNDVICTEDLKEFFNNIIDQILAEKNNRLLIIVDELDRCRPTYAIEMLECIKHFYSNDKITFLVVTDNIQLSKTIKKVYGSEYDGELYLNRFYDSVIELSNNINTFKTAYISSLYGKDITETDLFNEITMTCINYFKLELRQINSFIEYAKTAQNIIGDYYNNSLLFKQSLAYCICCISYGLKVTSVNEYDLYMQGKWNKLDEVLNSNVKLIEWLEEFIDIKSNDSFVSVLKQTYDAVFNGNSEIYTYDNFAKRLVLQILELQF